MMQIENKKSICSRMGQIEYLWDKECVKDATSHELWNEYENLLSSLCGLSMNHTSETYKDDSWYANALCSYHESLS